MENCENCLKTKNLCICDLAREFENKIQVLILQHPQEPDKTLGAAKLSQLCLKNSAIKVGLSWPNLRLKIQDSLLLQSQKTGAILFGERYTKERNRLRHHNLISSGSTLKELHKPTLAGKTKLKASFLSMEPGAKQKPFGGEMRGFSKHED